MKMSVSGVILLCWVTSLAQAQPVAQGVLKLPPKEFVDIATGEKELPPNVAVFTLDRPEQGQSVNPRPRMSLPDYGSTISAAQFSEKDIALASSTSLYINRIFADVVDFGASDTSKMQATGLNVSPDAAAELVAYSETLAYLYRKSFNNKIGFACSELDSNLLGMGETNALKVFAEALDAAGMFITQFYLDAFVDLDRHLDPVVAGLVRERINTSVNTWNATSSSSLGSKATPDNWAWINGYCGARRKDQEAMK